MLHVLLVNDSSYSRGGATKVFLNCIGAALSQGCTVSVLVGDDGAHVRQQYPEARVVALGDVPLRDNASPREGARKTFNRQARDALEQMLASSPDDTVVHVHGWMQTLSPSIFYALKKTEFPIFVTAHDFFLTCPNGGFVEYSTSRICERTPMSLSCLVTNCDKRNYMHKLWRYNRMLVQYAVGRDFWRGVNVFLAHESMEDYFGPDRFRQFITMRSPVQPFVPTKIDVVKNEMVTFLGRMTAEKGVDVLAEALSLCGLPAQFLGAGPLVEQVRERLPKAIVTGWIDEKDVADRVRKSRVFVMPSRMPEPYGLVAVEAMSSGLPVVLTHNCLVSKEIVARGAGFAFEAGNAEELAHYLTRLSEDDDLVDQMSQRAYELGQTFARSPEDWDRDLVGHYRASMSSPVSIHATEPSGAVECDSARTATN